MVDASMEVCLGEVLILNTLWYAPELGGWQMQNATHCVEMRISELSSRRTAETSRIRRISEIGLSLTGSHSTTIGLFTLRTQVVNFAMLVACT